jgi:hypothetical protein
MGLLSSHFPLAAARAHAAEAVLLGAGAAHWPSFRPEGRRALYLARWQRPGPAAFALHLWASAAAPLLALAPPFPPAPSPPARTPARTPARAGGGGEPGAAAGRRPGSLSGLPDASPRPLRWPLSPAECAEADGGAPVLSPSPAHSPWKRLSPAECAVAEAAAARSDPLAWWTGTGGPDTGGPGTGGVAQAGAARDCAEETSMRTTGRSTSGAARDCALLLPLTSLPDLAPRLAPFTPLAAAAAVAAERSRGQPEGRGGAGTALLPLAFWPLSRAAPPPGPPSRDPAAGRPGAESQAEAGEAEDGRMDDAVGRFPGSMDDAVGRFPGRAFVLPEEGETAEPGQAGEGEGGRGWRWLRRGGGEAAAGAEEAEEEAGAGPEEIVWLGRQAGVFLPWTVRLSHFACRESPELVRGGCGTGAGVDTLCS